MSKYPAPEKESVRDYPRPPRLEAFGGLVRVEWAGREVARSERAFRVLETYHPPTYYIPRADVDMSLLRPVDRSSICEFKGRAAYFDLELDDHREPAAAWNYPAPAPAFQPIKDALCFYATRVDACFVNEERVRPQEGDFYGGWITSWISGPIKGGPGTAFW